jgi:membrane-associated phospholipid phosphatase
MAVASAAADASPKAGPAAPTVALTDATGALSLDLTPKKRSLFFEGDGWIPFAIGAGLLLATDRKSQPFLTDALANPTTLRASRAVGVLGTPRVYLGTPLLLYALGGKREKQTATRLVNALVTSGLITETTKVLVGRRRPDESGGVGDVKGPSLVYESFPSGHTSAAFAMATVLATQYPRYRVPLYALAAAVAASRVLQNRHFPSDVFVGAGIGIAAGQQAAHGGSNLLGFKF